ncbi:DUF305 domain-containing protein [Agrobacterium tumefaciens]|uniref:DUF305 domain-containing protein n=1 Tax=uncultured Agrobacterium sp. TaxID=157277 RepID=UPI000712F8F5|nr:DUF305 domain-containing protein [uncultured Agrobacterium sp.]KQZ91730.1 hypothetical protein ASD74_20425 [Rhizobium sp. Root564]NTE84704.1 DUF305 domain-containing protein [Agrobacterium tumefaciens]
MNHILKMKIANALFIGAFFSTMPMANAQTAFPDMCKSEMASTSNMSMQNHNVQMADMTDYQKESMDGMKAMSMNMMQGMMKKDPDVAFACGMIAHHMGAISMAQVELKYGDNADNKARAQKIIDDQTKEIKELTAWVEKEAK